jgi:hypothetical protein
MTYLKKINKNVRQIVCHLDNKKYIWCTDCNKP